MSNSPIVAIQNDVVKSLKSSIASMLFMNFILTWKLVSI